MLTKVIEQAKIDHFTKWFERADKIVIVSHVLLTATLLVHHWDYIIFWIHRKKQ